jgi:hypothetical protein
MKYRRKHILASLDWLNLRGAFLDLPLPGAKDVNMELANHRLTPFGVHDQALLLHPAEDRFDILAAAVCGL